MNCQNCGTEYESEAKFCGHCGSQITTPSIDVDLRVAETDLPTETDLPMVGFVEAITRAFRNYAKFDGRATRAENWWFALFNMLVRIALGLLEPTGTVGGLFGLATLVPSLAVGARRLHDINRSGWWQLLWLLPVIGWIVVIYWGIKKGDDIPNKYGPNPRRALPK